MPAGIFLGWRLLRRRVEFRPGLLTLTVAVAVVGAFPWLWANAQSRHHLFPFVRPLRSRTHRTRAISPSSSHMSCRSCWACVSGPNGFFKKRSGRPGQGGWRIPRGSGWATALGEIVFAAALAGFLVWMVVLIRRRQALVLVGAALLVPFA